MYAISLWQPWASLIAEGIKVQETRSWSPPHWLIGERIAIHAAKRQVTKALLKHLPKEIHDPMIKAYGWDWLDSIPYGAVICTAELFGVAQIVDNESDSAMRDKGSLPAIRVKTGEHIAIVPDPYGDYSAGRYIWGLRSIIKKGEPIPMKGQKGLWKCDVS